MCLIISFVHSARNFPINFIVSRMKHNAAAVAWKLDPLLARETCWLVYARIDILLGARSLGETDDDSTVA
jgi:hypothetical protein